MNAAPSGFARFIAKGSREGTARNQGEITQETSELEDLHYACMHHCTLLDGWMGVEGHTHRFVSSSLVVYHA